MLSSHLFSLVVIQTTAHLVLVEKENGRLWCWRNQLELTSSSIDIQQRLCQPGQKLLPSSSPSALSWTSLKCVGADRIPIIIHTVRIEKEPDKKERRNRFGLCGLSTTSIVDSLPLQPSRPRHRKGVGVANCVCLGAWNSTWLRKSIVEANQHPPWIFSWFSLGTK